MRGREIRLCAWSAPVATIFFVLALLVAMRFVPPLSPLLSADDISLIFRSNDTGIKLGAVLMVLATMLLIPFTGAISAVLDNMDEPPKALSKTQQLSAVLAFAPLMYASYMFAAAAFRPERSPELILALSDLGWIFLVMTPGLVQPVAIGFAIIFDRSIQPLFPRWLAFLNFWFGSMFAGGMLNPLFKRGPFAWDGVIAFWVPAGIFSIWVMAMFICLLRASRMLDAQDAVKTPFIAR